MRVHQILFKKEKRKKVVSDNSVSGILLDVCGIKQREACTVSIDRHVLCFKTEWKDRVKTVEAKSVSFAFVSRRNERKNRDER